MTKELWDWKPRSSTFTEIFSLSANHLRVYLPLSLVLRNINKSHPNLVKWTPAFWILCFRWKRFLTCEGYILTFNSTKVVSLTGNSLIWSQKRHSEKWDILGSAHNWETNHWIPFTDCHLISLSDKHPFLRISDAAWTDELRTTGMSCKGRSWRRNGHFCKVNFTADDSEQFPAFYYSPAYLTSLWSTYIRSENIYWIFTRCQILTSFPLFFSSHKIHRVRGTFTVLIPHIREGTDQ